jgi:nucleotide-binding universal stress UspA family protein
LCGVALKILLAIDDQPQSRRMLTYVASNEVFFRPTFEYSLIHVFRNAMTDSDNPPPMALMVRSLDFLRTQGIQAHTLYRDGDAATEIIETADRLRFNMIVMGSRGHSALQSLVLGSVTTQVLARAKMPVLVVR